MKQTNFSKSQEVQKTIQILKANKLAIITGLIGGFTIGFLSYNSMKKNQAIKQKLQVENDFYSRQQNDDGSLYYTHPSEKFKLAFLQ